MKLRLPTLLLIVAAGVPLSRGRAGSSPGVPDQRTPSTCGAAVVRYEDCLDEEGGAVCEERECRDLYIYNGMINLPQEVPCDTLTMATRCCEPCVDVFVEATNCQNIHCTPPGWLAVGPAGTLDDEESPPPSGDQCMDFDKEVQQCWTNETRAETCAGCVAQYLNVDDTSSDVTWNLPKNVGPCSNLPVDCCDECQGEVITAINCNEFTCGAWVQESEGSGAAMQKSQSLPIFALTVLFAFWSRSML